MSNTPKDVRLSCGCVSRWNEAQEQYTTQHTCSPQQRRAQRVAEIQRFNDETARRRHAPLYSRPFNILR